MVRHCTARTGRATHRRAWRLVASIDEHGMGAHDDAPASNQTTTTTTTTIDELIDVCTRAERAPESEPQRALDALRLIESFTAFDDAMFTDARFAQCGKIINTLRKKHGDDEVKAAASRVKAAWTKMILARAEPDAKKQSAKEEKPGKIAAAAAAPVAEEKDGNDPLHEAKVAIKNKLELVDDPARDRTREIFAEALAPCMMDGKVKGVTIEKLASIAAKIENAMTAKWPDGGKDYKTKVRQLAFNLKDAKNPDLRTSMANGDITSDVLIELSPEELGSNERRLANERIRELAEWEAVRGQQQEASTDAFKCGKCKQRACTYYQLQTRSADEPMTTFITCVNCGNRWKIC